MKGLILRAMRSCFLAFAILALVYSTTGLASVMLAPGSGPTLLMGTSLRAETDLGGGVIYDELMPFSILNKEGEVIFSGVLQDRVVQSHPTGLLHFYYRIRDTQVGLSGIVAKVQNSKFDTSAEISVDWRSDGSGVISPYAAQRSIVPGAWITFDFNTAGGETLCAGKESKFFYIRSLAKKFSVNGTTFIILQTGEIAKLRTSMPVM